MRKSYSFLLLTLFFSMNLLAQSAIQNALSSHGFEKVLIEEEAELIWVFFEHRNFRNPAESMAFASKIIRAHTDKFLVFIPVFHNRPMGKYFGKEFLFKEIDKSDRQLFFQGTATPYRFNLRLMPDITAQFGFLENPLATRTNLIVDTRIYLARGLALHTGMTVPLVNSLDKRDVRPHLSPTHFSYFLSFNSRHFFLLQAGTFFSDRYGGDFQYRYSPLSSAFSMGVSTSLTGYYLQSWNALRIGGIKLPTWNFDISYAIGRLGLDIQLRVGQFLYGDKGGRLDLIRQYGNVDFGLHYSYTTLDQGIGAQVAFPLFPGKLFRSKHVELRATEEFRWEYQYRPNYPKAAKDFRTGTPRLDNVLRQYRSAFIQGIR
ncbi:YjbH domain-containing protein [Cecembia rubra]|uniref:Exopolysaccharide biosynthesis protein YbjH n=1 Tax=Cecembia rubra TaxID=1485585 RepID=A0A2P8E3E5_9BACT|nr:YjbH domain-containing protein [Cecembia rubra]PSL03976.1 exopolysaccharide biosynthesis protein YbjH [Cecembia rubra]